MRKSGFMIAHSLPDDPMMVGPPGLEPGPRAPKARMLPLNTMARLLGRGNPAQLFYPRIKFEIMFGAAVSNPTTSIVPASFGSAIEN